MSRVLKSEYFIFTLAIVLSFVAGDYAVWIKFLLVPAQSVVIALSATKINNQDFTSARHIPAFILVSFVLNYVVMTSIILITARWLFDDPELWSGYVVTAVMPPAIMVMPLSYLLNANLVFSIVSIISLYLLSIVLAPFLSTLILGAEIINPARLAVILVQVILVPIIVSRFLARKSVVKYIASWRDTAIKWSFFITVYIALGLNREIFWTDPNTLVRCLVISVIVTFVLGFIIYFIARGLKIDYPNSVTCLAMGTKKNSGLASTVALLLISQRAAFPGAILSLFDNLSFMWWALYFRKRKHETANVIVTMVSHAIGAKIAKD